MADPATVPAGRYAYELLKINHLLTEIGKNVKVYGDSNEKVSTYVILKR